MPYVYIYRRDVAQISDLLSLTVPCPKKNNLGFLYYYTLVGIFYYDLTSYEMINLDNIFSADFSIA